MKPKYAEGLGVAKKFEAAMKTLLRSPKPKVERKPKAVISEKKPRSDKD